MDMNNDLISREALKEAINSNIEQATKAGIVVDADYLWELLNYAIDNAPTVEPKQGEWILQYRSCGDAYYTCSLCNRAVEVDNGYSLKDYPFCHCGANMKGGAE